MEVFYFSFISSYIGMNQKKKSCTFSLPKSLYFLSLKLKSNCSCGSNGHLRECILLLFSITLNGNWLHEALERVTLELPLIALQSRMFMAKWLIKGKVGR